jgi:hypothetical protein
VQHQSVSFDVLLTAGGRNELGGELIGFPLVHVHELGVPPIRISFVAALREAVEQWHFAALASPGKIPERLSTATDRLRQFLLPPRRPERVFPRAVKIKMSNYMRKLPSSTRKPAN